jgi:hypothetical protein
MSDHKKPMLPPTVASPGRRAFHTLIALAGWALFAYWWTVVVRHVDASQVRFTVLFVLAALVVSVVITSLWILHNRAIFRRKGPRTQVRDAVLDYSRDPLGRTVTFETASEDLRSAPAVRVLIDGAAKSYRPAMRPKSQDKSA